MKLLIILVLVTIAAAEWQPKSREQLRQDRLNCMKEVNLSDEMKNYIKSFLEYPNNDMIKNYVLCGARISELWTDSTGWIADRIMLLMKDDIKMNADEVRQAIEACLDNNSQGSPLNEWAYRNFNCVVNSKAREAFARIMKKIE